MFLLSSSYRKIIAVSLTLCLIVLFNLQPFALVLAEETTTITEEPLTENPTETEVPEPVQADGTDGAGGTDGTSGATGDSAEGSADTNETASGETGDSTGNGSEGEAGTDASNESPVNETVSGDTSIETGDATAAGDLENYVDVNELRLMLNDAYDKYAIPLGYIIYDPVTEKYVAFDEQSQAKLDKALEDGVVDPYEFLDIVTPETDTTASTTNVTVLENEAEVTADTGNNTASGSSNVTINTGDAVATANTLNVVNTNIYDSEGFFMFLDNLAESGVHGDLDLRDFDFFQPQEATTVTNARESNDKKSVLDRVTDKIKAICPTCGGGGDVTINTDQEAAITNDIIIRSNSGANAGLGNSGTTDINSGDAYAAANTINLANTNIVDSNYLLLTFNNYGDWDSDIVFPSGDDLLDSFGVGGQSTPPTTVDTTNTIDVQNNANVGADTGNNVSAGAAARSVTTGDATAANNVLNQLNQNLVGGTSFSVLVKVHGEWSGDVVGAPEGIEWRETADGIELFYDADAKPSTVSGYDQLNVTGTNDATINNNIQVVALTGDNKIEGGSGGSINTGDAHAAANTINVANTNVIGKNWLMAVVNVFGDWNGNLTFGQSDLWIGVQAEFDGKAEMHERVTYHVTVINFGDAPATDVTLTADYDPVKLHFLNSEINSGQERWYLGTIRPGETREFTYHGEVTDSIPYGTDSIVNTFSVAGAEEDLNIDNNTETLTFETHREYQTFTNGKKITYSPSPELSITKTHNRPYGIVASNTVDYTIMIENTGPGVAYNAELHDVLSSNGDKLYEEVWDLGSIFPGEHIEIAYTTFYNAATEPGTYTNTAYVDAFGGHPSFLYGRSADSDTVSADVTITAPAYIPPEIIVEEIEIVEEEVIEHNPGVVPEDFPLLEIEVPELPLEPTISRAPEVTFESQGVLHEHPLFTQHPLVYERQHDIVHDHHLHPEFTSHPIFIAEGALPEPFIHPLFTQHPISPDHVDPLVHEQVEEGRQVHTEPSEVVAIR